MPFTSGDDGDDDLRMAAQVDRNKEAWQQTLDDMTAMAEDRETAGWETLVVAAGHTAPEAPAHGDTDRFGLVHIVPGNKADPLIEAVDQGEFPVYEVYLGETETRVFLVTELLSPDIELAIYVAGNYRHRDAGPLIETAREEERMYTYLQKLDGTVLGSFEHDGYEKFFSATDLRAHADT